MKKICQLYMPSFYRSYGKNALKAATGLLKNIKNADFEGVYLISLFQDGGYDNGFDVVDYVVNPAFGTKEDLDAFIRIAHSMDLCVGVDVVPNHVSDRNILAQNCLNGVPGYEDSLYVVSRGEAQALTESGVPSFFGKLAYSDFGDKFVRSTFADYHQLNLNWNNQMVIEYFSSLFRKLKKAGIDFARVDCGMMLHEDVSKANPANPMACMNPEKSVNSIIDVSDGMLLFFEWFDPTNVKLFEDIQMAYALDCSYVMTGALNTKWEHPKLIPLVGGHDQMTLADRGFDCESILAKMYGSDYGFLDMQTLLGWKTDERILPGDEMFDADLKNVNHRYRARRPIEPVVESFKARFK